LRCKGKDFFLNYQTKQEYFFILFVFFFFFLQRRGCLYTLFLAFREAKKR